MTEFAACRRDNLCQQCKHGETSPREHPWQKWTEAKRENVLNRLAKSLVRHVDFGVGLAHTKEDYEEHVRNSPARAVANEPVGDQHFTFAVQQCGGKLAEWRATHGQANPLRFVFDMASKKERHEIARVFFAAAKEREKYQGGIEKWFEPEGVVFESRKSTMQLLSADMVAWTIASIRARELTLRGRYVELFQVAKVFVGTEHIRIGYTNKETLARWESDTLSVAAQRQSGKLAPRPIAAEFESRWLKTGRAIRAKVETLGAAAMTGTFGRGKGTPGLAPGKIGWAFPITLTV